ncbi:MAG TPA: 2-phospho-L-lactate guanylyltransferase [Candidatus Limnocylindrales bacterium]|nr:2-phospho-L-lactate guanylyltransferase [Candidatus Limnocylindrales bacterium]
MPPVTRADLSRTWALVPIRGLETAKTRLGGDLDAEERTALVTELLRRTLAATRDARRIAGTVVVTMDGAAAEIARRHRAVGLVERAPGLNAAIAAARSVAQARGATAVLVLPADLPAVSPSALDALVEAASAQADAVDAGEGAPDGIVALVPDRHGEGTNALLLSPPDRVAPAFGAASHARHAAAARAAGARLIELDGPLSLDVDTAADLLEAEAALGSLRG